MREAMAHMFCSWLEHVQHCGLSAWLQERALTPMTLVKSDCSCVGVMALIIDCRYPICAGSCCGCCGAACCGGGACCCGCACCTSSLCA